MPLRIAAVRVAPMNTPSIKKAQTAISGRAMA